MRRWPRTPGSRSIACSPCLSLDGVKLRRNETPEAADTVVVDPAGKAGGKGRPTPKRRDTALPRGPVSAPKTRKEALARQKQLSKNAKTQRRASAIAPLTPVERREALRRGDPSVLPRRDQGPTKRLARDYVDSRRMISNYLLVLLPIMAAGYVPQLRALSYLTPVLFLVILAEWYLTGRRLRRLAVERLNKADGTALGLGFYAGSRAYLPRKWRLPAPRVELGDQI